jgi:hypothetical protein
MNKVMKRVVLIHGYVSDERKELLGSMGFPHTIECWQDGGYLITLATNFEVDSQAVADTYIGVIYENEDSIPDVRPNEDSPVFTGLQDPPIELLNDELETSFLFVAGMHGCDEDGELYES